MVNTVALSPGSEHVFTVCVCFVLVTDQNLSRVYPALYPAAAGIGSSDPHDPACDKAGIEDGYMYHKLKRYICFIAALF